MDLLVDDDRYAISCRREELAFLLGRHWFPINLTALRDKRIPHADAAQRTYLIHLKGVTELFRVIDSDAFNFTCCRTPGAKPVLIDTQLPQSAN